MSQQPGNLTKTQEITIGDSQPPLSQDTVEDNRSFDTTNNEVKFFNLTSGCVNIDPTTPFGMHRSTFSHDRFSSTSSSDNFPFEGNYEYHDKSYDRSITIPSSGDVYEQRRQLS